MVMMVGGIMATQMMVMMVGRTMVMAEWHDDAAGVEITGNLIWWKE